MRVIKYFCDLCKNEVYISHESLCNFRFEPDGSVEVCNSCWKGIKKEVLKRRKEYEKARTGTSTTKSEAGK